jgi:tetratricopeptide (TPR) repeat protein
MNISFRTIRIAFVALTILHVGCIGSKSQYQSGRPSVFDQNDPYAQLALARKHLNQFFTGDEHSPTDITDAIKAAESAIRQDPEMAEAYYFFGYATAVKGLVEAHESTIRQGLADYRKSLALNPALKTPGVTTGFLMPLPCLVAKIKLRNHKTGDEDLNWIISLLHEAIKIFPDFAEAHSLLSSAYEAMGNDDLALQEAKVAAELAPDQTESHKEIGRLYFKLYIDIRDEKRVMAAARKGIDALKKAIRLNPDDSDAHEMLAIFFGAIGQYDLKHFTIETAIALENDASRQFELSSAYLARGDVNKAAHHYKAAIDIEKDFSLGLKGLAFCHYLKKEFEMARKTLLQYIKAEGYDSAYTVLWYYNSILGCGKQIQGDKYLQKYYKAFKGDAWEKYLLEYHIGRISEEDLLSHARQRFDQCEAYFYIGCHYWHFGNKRKAAYWFEKTIDTKRFDCFEYFGAKIRLAQLVNQ